MLLSCRKQPFFLQSTNCTGTYLELNFFTINNDSLRLEVCIPNFFGVALREADVIAKLLALAGNVAYTHNFINPSIQGYILAVFTCYVNITGILDVCSPALTLQKS